jgi:hypothetical protein
MDLAGAHGREERRKTAYPGTLRKNSKTPGGNADNFENKGVVEKATQKLLKTMELWKKQLRSC